MKYIEDLNKNDKIQRHLIDNKIYFKNKKYITISGQVLQYRHTINDLLLNYTKTNRTCCICGGLLNNYSNKNLFKSTCNAACERIKRNKDALEKDKKENPEKYHWYLYESDFMYKDSDLLEDIQNDFGFIFLSKNHDVFINYYQIFRQPELRKYIYFSDLKNIFKKGSKHRVCKICGGLVPDTDKYYGYTRKCYSISCTLKYKHKTDKKFHEKISNQLIRDSKKAREDPEKYIKMHNGLVIGDSKYWNNLSWEEYLNISDELIKYLKKI